MFFTVQLKEKKKDNQGYIQCHSSRWNSIIKFWIIESVFFIPLIIFFSAILGYWKGSMLSNTKETNTNLLKGLSVWVFRPQKNNEFSVFFQITVLVINHWSVESAYFFKVQKVSVSFAYTNATSSLANTVLTVSSLSLTFSSC